MVRHLPDGLRMGAVEVQLVSIGVRLVAAGVGLVATVLRLRAPGVGLGIIAAGLQPTREGELEEGRM